MSSKLEKYIIFLTLIFGCTGENILVTPKMSPGDIGGKFRILIEDRSDQKIKELQITKFLVVKNQSELESIGPGSLSDFKIPIGKEGIAIEIPTGSYVGIISFWNGSDFSDRVSLKVLFKEDSKIQCSMEFIDDGLFFNDELNCGFLKIFPNKETILKLTITDRYDIRIGGLFVALLTLGILTPPSEIRHVEASIINPK